MWGSVVSCVLSLVTNETHVLAVRGGRYFLNFDASRWSAYCMLRACCCETYEVGSTSLPMSWVMRYCELLHFSTLASKAIARPTA